jgi:nucleotide-binding universal stress UspA family protein
VSAVIAHTTDLSGDDGAAFVHATAIAAASGARLITLHGNAPATEIDRLPDAAPLAARWGRPVAHARLCHECCDDVTDTLLDALHELAPDLVVTGTHARHGVAALLRGSVSEALARNLDVPVLVVPNRGRGFVDGASGAIDLHRILIPAVDSATAARGLAAAHAVLALAGVATAELVLLTVGDHPLDAPLDAGVRVVRARGAVDDAILAAARERAVCLIVMPTRGHDEVGDALFGSHTEHVIRNAGTPVLTVPMR